LSAHKQTFTHFSIRSLVFSPRAVLSEIADCLGASLSEPLQFQVKSSKSHGSGTDFIQAMIKTVDARLRLHNLTLQDREYAEQHLDPKLMKMFHYHGPMTEISLS
jgi:hypothetical protein